LDDEEPAGSVPFMALGPAWLGIGAQRCGTTWFTDLLTQHPSVTLAASGRKELHMLWRSLTSPIDADKYRAQFEGMHGLAGEFTPFYLRAPWVPPVAAQFVSTQTPIIVILRDPVERFASAMRLEVGRSDKPHIHRPLGSDAVWAGMYAIHLDIWSRWFGDQMIVLQYERIRTNPQPWVDQIWQTLGLAPVILRDTGRPSATTSQAPWTWPAGLKSTLRTIYRDEVEAVARRWDIDLDLWPTTVA